ncbi:hypothetical protein IW261DRAFT_189976 [Armillaria novae-zelandiae]|uniref:F-box domain-containing protein n=1 Tax=Armillaria novae-zelandiae TaxID=153914 RepID=A0AA39P766_9AGAR|nr:hypothetical protein IW261DRAFT_189976 [Armillaria novae-zelandiae]
MAFGGRSSPLLQLLRCLSFATAITKTANHSMPIMPSYHFAPYAQCKPWLCIPHSPDSRPPLLISKIPDLPAELIHCIFRENRRDIGTLRSCALVCRSWAPIAQCYLYETLHPNHQGFTAFPIISSGPHRSCHPGCWFLASNKIIPASHRIHQDCIITYLSIEDALARSFRIVEASISSFRALSYSGECATSDLHQHRSPSSLSQDCLSSYDHLNFAQARLYFSPARPV